MNTRAERRTIATPSRLVSLGMRPDEGLALRAAHYVFALEGQEHYSFPIRNADRAAERVHPDKKSELKTYFPLLAAGCLPQAGRPRKQVRAASLDEIAGRAGWKAASTVHRNRLRARLVGKRNKRVGGANRYELNVPQGETPSGVSPQSYWNPSLAQLREHFGGSHADGLEAAPDMFLLRSDRGVRGPLQQSEHGDRMVLPDLQSRTDGGSVSPSGTVKFREDLDDLSGYFYVQPWVWHPQNPVGVSARLVFTYLCSRGLLQRGGDGRTQTFLQIPLATIGRAVSLRPEAVRRALARWEGLGVLQVFRPPATRLEGKEGWEQEPLIVSYLPGAILTRDFRDVERKRILARAAALRAHAWWNQCGQQLQREIFAHLWEATRSGAHLVDFHHEISRRLTEQNVPSDVVSSLFSR